MATNKEQFKQELARIRGEDGYDGLDDRDTVGALEAFAKALNPDRNRPRLRKPRADGSLVAVDLTFNTATDYLQLMRVTAERGFDLLEGTAEEYNDFMLDMTDGELAWGGSIQRTTAAQYQSAARAFYRFLDEPGAGDDRPDAAIEWPAEEVIIFTDTSEPRYDESDMFEDSEVDCLREACLDGMNARRDRAFIELVAGTVQRVEALRTLLIRDVHTDPEDSQPYVLLNPEIQGDGDKGAIDNAGRWRPIVSDVGPIREFIAHHPLRDPDVRDEHGCPDRFEDCYLFVGDPNHAVTDASRPWNDTAIRGMLERLGNRAGVDKPVKPHNFRHWGYSKSKELDVDEEIRRKVFSWKSGSDMGDQVYGHVDVERAGRQFAEAWADEFGEGDQTVDSVSEQLVGGASIGDLPPEVKQQLSTALATDQEFLEMVAEEVVKSKG